MKYLVFDISSMLYRTFFQNKNEDVVTNAGLAHHMALMSMRKFYNKFKPHKVVMTFDRPSWRKEYTLSEDCVSGKKYKGNRRQKMTPKQQEKFAAFMTHIKEFEDLMRDHTNIICLSNEGLEADDLIAGFIEAYGQDGEDELIIVSRDRDLAQLLGPNVVQWDPQSGEQITIETAIRDLFKEKKQTSIPPELHTREFFLFAKKLRGDTGDNVQGAYPGIRKTKIVKIYEDDFERANTLNHTWTNEDEKKFIVKELFDEGDLLMNLQSQPDNIRGRVFATILNEMDRERSFSYFHFMKFLGKYEMKKIADSLDNFIPLLS